MNKAILMTMAACAAMVVSASAADVKENWDKDCAKCHGPDGKGETKMGKKLEVKDFTNAKVQADMKDDAMLKAIKEGVKDGEKVRMKPVEGLSDDEMKALVKFVRDFKK
jgi:cytochrome c6